MDLDQKILASVGIVFAIALVFLFVSPTGLFTLDTGIRDPSFETLSRTDWLSTDINDPLNENIRFETSELWQTDALRSLRVFGTAASSSELTITQVFRMPVTAVKLSVDINVLVQPSSGNGYRLEVCTVNENDPTQALDCISNPRRGASPHKSLGTTTLSIDIPESFKGKTTKISLRNIYAAGNLVEAYWDNVKLI